MKSVKAVSDKGGIYQESGCLMRQSGLCMTSSKYLAEKSEFNSSICLLLDGFIDVLFLSGFVFVLLIMFSSAPTCITLTFLPLPRFWKAVVKMREQYEHTHTHTHTQGQTFSLAHVQL